MSQFAFVLQLPTCIGFACASGISKNPLPEDSINLVPSEEACCVPVSLLTSAD
jgi:hypothetical protein